MPPAKRETLADPLQVRFRRHDLIRVREIAERSGESDSTIIRDLLSKAIEMHDYRRPAEVSRKGLQPVQAKSSLKQGTEGKSSAKVGKMGRKGRSYKNPVTDNPYTITGVSHTTEEEL